jgi:hypothetical protein
MDIHIRSKKTRQWSYISTAVLRIGDDVLEVAGQGDGDSYWINGVEGNAFGDAAVVGSLSGSSVIARRLNTQQREYVVDLGNEQSVVLKTWKDLVRVDVRGADADNFASSVGLMGTFPEGAKMARDHLTLLDDVNKFGQEWQVKPSEPKLFRSIDGPQFPSKCEVPSRSSLRRRLAASSVSLEDAELACSRVSAEDRDLCIFDVMATNDKDAAGAY